MIYEDLSVAERVSSRVEDFWTCNGFYSSKVFDY